MKKRKASAPKKERNSKKRKTDQEGDIKNEVDAKKLPAEALPFDMSRLPLEILADYIFKYFAFDYWLQSLSLVSKQWYQACIHSNADKQLLIHTSLPQNMLKFFTIASTYKITTIALHGVAVAKSRLTAMLNSSPRLNTFVVFKTQGILPAYGDLTFNSIKTVYIDSSMMHLFPKATRVQFSEKEVNWTSRKQFPNVVELAVHSCADLGQLLKSFPALKVLHISSLKEPVSKKITVHISSTGDENWRKNYSYDQIWASPIFKTPVTDLLDGEQTSSNSLKAVGKFTSAEYEIHLQSRCNEYKFPAVSRSVTFIAPRKAIPLSQLASRLIKFTPGFALLFCYKYFPAIDALAMLLHVGDDKDNIEKFLRENSQELAEKMTPTVFLSLVVTFEATVLKDIFSAEQLRHMLAVTDKTGCVLFELIETDGPDYFTELVEEYGPISMPDLIEVKNENEITPIHHAMTLGKLKWVKYLIGEGATINVTKLFGDDDEELRNVRYTGSNDDEKDITKLQKIVEMMIEKDAITSPKKFNWFFDVNWIDLSANEMIRMLHFFAVILKIKDFNKVQEDNPSSEHHGTSLINYMIQGWNASTKVIEYAARIFKINLNLTDGNGMTPVLTAIDRGSVAMMEWLLENGTEPTPATGPQPLYNVVAKKFSNEDTMEFIDSLLARGADINAYSEDRVTKRKFTTLLYAVEAGGPLEIIEYLVARGSRLDLTDSNGNTVLHAAIKCQSDIIRFLAPRVTDVNKRNYDGFTPLEKAMMEADHENIISLLNHFDVDFDQPRPGLNMTPLMLACLFSRHETAQVILTADPDIRGVDVHGHSFVYYLVKYFKNHENFVYPLKDWLTNTCPHLITPENTQFMVVEAKKVIELSNQDPLLLHNVFRLCTSYLIVAEFLFECIGFDINAQDSNGDVLLSYPAADAEISQYLLSKNPNVNVQNNDGDTPLMLALQRNAEHWYCKALIEHGADVTLKNKFGVSVSAVLPDVLAKFKASGPRTYYEEQFKRENFS